MTTIIAINQSTADANKREDIDIGTIVNTCVYYIGILFY